MERLTRPARRVPCDSTVRAAMIQHHEQCRDEYIRHIKRFPREKEEYLARADEHNGMIRFWKHIEAFYE